MKSKEIALSAVLVALTSIILYLNLLIPINTLSILTLASFIIPIAMIRGSIKSAFLVYIASTIIGFFFLPINIVLLYGIFFGVYGIVKCYIEKLNKLYLEIIFKLLFFNAILFILLFLFNTFLSTEIIKLPLWLIYVVSQPAFLIFDYALTLLISFYMQKIHNKI
jgi:hypothetical protein